MNIAYYLVQNLAKSAVGIYFRKVYVIGEDNIPKDGPVILCGNHSNQFIDPMMILKFSKRKVNFTMAATSYNKRIIGTCARMINVIPVNRPEDFRKKGTGKIKILNSKELILVNGNLEETNKFGAGFSIQIGTNPDDNQNFDNKVDLKEFYWIPKIENKVLFQQVYNSLKNNECICVFPEGTSHDRTEFIKLKAGIALFSLGAMSEYGSKNIKIVPVGLNYFNRDQFRSEVIIEFSKPYEVPSDLAELYKLNKREATEILLSEIESRMKAVTWTAPTYNELRSILFVRKLYAPPDTKLSPAAYSELCKRFAKGYLKLKELPETQNLMNEIKKYIVFLENTGLTDHEVKRMDFSFSWIFKKTIISFFALIILLLLTLPGVLIAYPFVLYLEKKAENERLLAKAKNPNKIEALDVVSSVKIQYGVLCLPIVLFLWILWTLFFYKYFIINKYLDFTYFNVGLFSLLIFPLYFYIVLVSLDLIGYYKQKIYSRLLYLIIPKMIKQIKEEREDLVTKTHSFIEKYIEEIDIKFKREYIINEIDDIDESDVLLKKTSGKRKKEKSNHYELERLSTSNSNLFE